MSEGDLHQPHHGRYPDAPASGSSLLNCSQQNDRVAFLSVYRCEQLGVIISWLVRVVTSVTGLTLQASLNPAWKRELAIGGVWLCLGGLAPGPDSSQANPSPPLHATLA